MKKIILFFGVLIVCMPLIFGFNQNELWEYFGNNESNPLNYQSGSNGFALGQIKSASLSHNSTQVRVLDLDNDGVREIVTIGYNNIKIYDLNLSIEASISTGDAGSQVVYDVVDFIGSTPNLEIITLMNPISNLSKENFRVYTYDGSVIRLNKSFAVDPIFSSVSQMRCSVDYDKDGDLDCMFATAVTGSTRSTLAGYDVNSNSATQLTFNISMGTGRGIVPTENPPQFIDANNDGSLEALFVDASQVAPVVMTFNQTSYIATMVLTHPVISVFHGEEAMWYQADSGDYEVLTAGVINGYATMGTDYRDVGLSLNDYKTGVQLDVTPVADLCIHLGFPVSHGTTFERRVGMSATGLDKGSIYIWGHYRTSNAELSEICKFNYTLNLVQKSDVYNNDRNFIDINVLTFTLANVYGNTENEFIASSGVYSLASGYRQYPLFDESASQWCIPVNVDSDSRLELICTYSGSIYIMDEEGVGGGLENLRPIIYSTTLDKYAVKTKEPISLTINAWDNEGDAIYYAIDCDSEGVESSLFSVPLLNQFSCSYLYNGTKQVKVYVNDVAHGGGSADISTWTTSSVSVYVGDSNQITPCFSPFMLCDDFNYIMPLILNDWYVTSMSFLGLDSGVVPIGNKLILRTNDAYYLAKYFNPHKYGIITAVFNASFNTSGNDALEFTIGNSNNPTDTNSVQVLLRFAQNKIYSVYIESGNSSLSQIGTYSNGVMNNYKIQVFYDEYKNFGNVSYPRLRNTYDVYKSGVLLAKGLNFYHGTRFLRPNVTDDFTSYSDYITFTSEYMNLTLDDVYVYKGTDPNVDTLIQLDNTQVTQEWSTINEYFGCVLVKGDPNLVGKFDCNYKPLNCQDCCGYVNKTFQVVDTTCVLTKTGRQYGDKFQKWVFKNLWLFMFGVFAFIVVFMLTRNRRRN